MLKSGGTTVIDWLRQVANVCMNERKVPRDWQRAIIVPLYRVGKNPNFYAKTQKPNGFLTFSNWTFGYIYYMYNTLKLFYCII